MTAPQMQLATFMSETHDGVIPIGVRQQASDLIVDSIACALPAPRHEEYAAVNRVARLFGSAPPCTVLGSAETLSPAGATLLNGYGATAWTICDTHPSAATHLMPTILPPLLALAETRGIAGRRMLVAAAIGIEVGTRLGHAMGGLKDRGWHPPGIIGTIAAAAAVSNLLGLAPTPASHALSLAASQASGPMSAWPTPAVKLHQFHAALAGLIAATLAEAGFTAPLDELTSENAGLLTLMAGEPKPDALTAALGRDWHLGEVRMREVPGGVGLQLMLRTLGALSGDIDPAHIEGVTVTFSPKVYKAHSGVGWPSSSFEALLSVPYLAATILATGDLWLDDLEPSRLSDPRTRAIADVVALEQDPDLVGPQCRVVVRLTAGGEARDESLDIEPLLPLHRNDVIRKFVRCAGSASTDAQTIAEDLYQALESDDPRSLHHCLQKLPTQTGT